MPTTGDTATKETNTALHLIKLTLRGGARLDNKQMSKSLFNRLEIVLDNYGWKKEGSHSAEVTCPRSQGLFRTKTQGSNT